MKLTVMGGGGVRTPLFVASALRREERLGLEEICLMDIDGEKLNLMSALGREVVRSANAPVKITTTTDARGALAGARHIVMTVRVGNESGRVLDERIALRQGVLGQETTGPGGFAMALRNIPVILNYAELAEQVSPGAWIFNFTNPAGLVVQALHDHGFKRVLGICDSANAAQAAVAHWLKVDAHRLRAEVFGLNHLSWTRRVLLDGQDVLADLLRNPAFLSGTSLRIFAPEVIQHIGMWLNEYLYYYYSAERAVESLQAEELTRGEEVLELNRKLLDRLRTINPERDPQAALKVFFAYQQRRGATYMHYAQPEAPTLEEADERAADAQTPSVAEDREGYAGVALDIIEALETGEPLYTGLNVPNANALPCLRPEDVVEVSCVVDRAGVRPLLIGDIPEPQELLIRTIKLYERLTVEAIRTHSRATAVAALMAHPLVLSYSRATRLVDDYLAAHARYVGVWN